MDAQHCRRCGPDRPETDHGPDPFTANLASAARQNRNFRTAFWTGRQLQMTLMSIPPHGEIGWEVHPDTDQLIRVEAGLALVRMGGCQEEPEVERRLSPGEAIFVPQGTRHNILNPGSAPLKLSSVYAPPHHPRGTVQECRE